MGTIMMQTVITVGILLLAGLSACLVQASCIHRWHPGTGFCSVCVEDQDNPTHSRRLRKASTDVSIEWSELWAAIQPWIVFSIEAFILAFTMVVLVALFY